MAAELVPRRPWRGRRVLLGVTGSIAAYKAIQLARDLTRLGALVDVILTDAAQRFVAPLSFEGVTGRRALTSLFSAEGAALHISLAREADVVCVAPATADFIARAAQGRADDLLCTTLLATRAPVVVCPAMNDGMFAHPQVQENLAHLREKLGYAIAGPAKGALAVGEARGGAEGGEEQAPGRMLEPSEIEEHVGRALGMESAWAGRSVLVTGGPTREALDPVRYLGNRSSGRMGYALSQAAWRRGAAVTLVSGPSSLAAPVGVELVRVETAAQMHDAVAERIGAADVSIFAAAVADYRPTDARPQKVKREAAGESFAVALAANPDIAQATKSSRRPGSVSVGFALETSDLVANASRKLESKGFDLVVANDATEEGAGFEVATNRVTILTRGRAPEALPLLSKDDVAEEILDRVTPLLEAAAGSRA